MGKWDYCSWAGQKSSGWLFYIHTKWIALLESLAFRHVFVQKNYCLAQISHSCHMTMWHSSHFQPNSPPETAVSPPSTQLHFILSSPALLPVAGHLQGAGPRSGGSRAGQLEGRNPQGVAQGRGPLGYCALVHWIGAPSFPSLQCD